MATGVLYGAAADEVISHFDAYFQGSSDRPFLVISFDPLGNAAADALQKSLKALGYTANSCSFIQLSPKECSISLDPDALRLLIEGVDPYRIICADAQCIDALNKSYRLDLVPNAINRIMGRTCGIFSNLDALVQNDVDKYLAWEIFKALK